MIIAQISDTHLALDTPDTDQRISDFERTVADINALDPLPDVIVHTGDIVHNGRADEYAQAVAILGKARAPVYVIPGNKDDRANLRAAFAPRGYLAPGGAGFIDYAIEDHAVRLIGVDTLNAGSNKGDFCAERARRLIELIDAEPTKPIAVFAHHPPFMVPVGPDPLNFETPEMMERLRRALQHSGRVVGVFSGHVHRPSEGDVEGIPAIVVPCIATTLRKGEYPAHMKSRPVYYLHRYDPAWGVTTEARIVGTRSSVASIRSDAA
ncbi:MAG TPA: metallophosphoesterase [Pseudolabrys sp.]|nr:metallophosphoesterase [Pseudolabrys sp.]